MHDTLGTLGTLSFFWSSETVWYIWIFRKLCQLCQLCQCKIFFVNWPRIAFGNIKNVSNSLYIRYLFVEYLLISNEGK